MDLDDDMEYEKITKLKAKRKEPKPPGIPPIYAMATLQGKNGSATVKTLVDTGNTLKEDCAIHAELHRKLGVGFAVTRQGKCGTAKAGTSLVKLGISNPIILKLQDMKTRITIQPSVVESLSDQLNLGVSLLGRLGMEKKTAVEFEGGKTTLKIGTEETGLIRQINAEPRRGRDQARDTGTPRKREVSRAGRPGHAICAVETRCKANTLTFVKTIFPPKCRSKTVLVEREKRDGLEVVGAVYKGQEGMNRIAVLNTGDTDLTIHTGTRLGKLEIQKVHKRVPQEQEALRRVKEADRQTPVRGEDTPEIAAHKAKILEDLKVEANPMLKKNPEAMKRLKGMIDRYWRVFGEPDVSTGLTDLAEFKIELKPGATPQRAQVRPLNPAQLESLRAQMKIWKDEGVIEEAESPWASALVPAKKKGGLIRWAIDYRKLNEVTVADSYPLPSIEMNLERLAGARVFSALDAAAAYNVIPVEEKSRPLLAFITPMGLYTYKRMPFGPKNSGAVYARFIESLLDGLKSDQVIAYLDDVLVFTTTVEEHLDVLDRVLLMHERAGIKLRPLKTKLFEERTEYLGFEVSQDGVAMQQGYIDRIMEWPTPTTPKELATFLGFVGYYRGFIRQFAELTHEMHAKKKEKVLEWTETMQRDFETLKQEFSKKPIRSYPRYELDEPFQLTTDFSAKALGGVLSQVQEGQERLLGCAARKCTPYERNYPSVKGELSALMYCTRKWEHLLRYKKFVVNTDSQALKYLRNLKTPTGIWFRWLEELSSYDFEVRHRAGKDNLNADALSRSEHHPEPTAEEVAEQENEFGPQLLRAVRELDQEEQERGIQKEIPSIKGLHRVAEELSREVLEETQREDEVLGQVRRWVERGRRPEKSSLRRGDDDLRIYHQLFDSLQIQDGLLYYKVRLNTQADEEVNRLVLPREKAGIAFEWAHKHPTAGHFGVTATQRRAVSRFYYPGMSSDLKRQIRGCNVCIAKTTRMNTHAGVHRPVATGAVGQEVFIDLVGPLPVTPDNMKYALTVEDGFTRHASIYPIPNKSAATVARTLVDKYLTVHGIPAVVKSDNGREFVNNIMHEVADRLQLTAKTTPVYNPHSNQVERFHRTLNQMLRVFEEREDITWSLSIPAVMMAYNTKVHQTTGVTPYFATFGREMRLPIDLIVQPPEQEGRAMTQMVDEMIARFRKIYRFMRQKQEAAIRRAASGYKNKILELKSGDLVWYLCPRQVPGKPPKLTDSWLGPYRVVGRANDVVWKITPNTYAGPSILVHEQRLLPCTDPDAKNRIPRHLQVNDEGDELGEEIRPPREGDDAPDEIGVPIALQAPMADMNDLMSPPRGGGATPSPTSGDPTQQNSETPNVSDSDTLSTDNGENNINLGVPDPIDNNNLQNEEYGMQTPDVSDNEGLSPTESGDEAMGRESDPQAVEEQLEPHPDPLDVQDDIMGGGEELPPLPESPTRGSKRRQREHEVEGDRPARRQRIPVTVPPTPPGVRTRIPPTKGKVRVEVPPTPPRVRESQRTGEPPAPTRVREPQRKKRVLSPDGSESEPIASGSGTKTKARTKKAKPKTAWQQAVRGGPLSSDDELMEHISSLREVEILIDQSSDEPKRSTPGSAAWDLWAAKSVTVPPRETARIPLKLKLAIPEGYWLLLLGRSSLAAKGVTVGGGVIDSDYRDDVQCLLSNQTAEPFKVQKGQRICQAVLLPRLDARFTRAETLPSPETVHEGFGSTGSHACDVGVDAAGVELGRVEPDGSGGPPGVLPRL